jgi:hypothetical protein
MRRALALALPCSVLLTAAACGGGGGDDGDDGPPDAGGPIPPTADLARDVVSTELSIDVTTRSATARITLAPSPSQGATLEIGDIAITSVTSGGGPLEFADRGDTVDIGVPATTAPLVLDIAYDYMLHNGMFAGADAAGFTLVWPYFCGNLFPCKSDPADGTTFTLALAGVPTGQTAVFPAAIATEAPSYQIAWAYGNYQQMDLGTTAAGTHVSAWHRPTEVSATTMGTRNLRAAFEWFETTLGPYRFGTEVGSVSVSWGPGAFGGMEHHPMWHVGSAAMADQETHVHEAAHGWFGDGIRIGCWEDFVLSEGTVTYLAGRALDVVDPPLGANIWQSYEAQLAGVVPTDPVWPASCGAIDILDDNLFTDAPYIRGAFFYRAVALRVGAAELDTALAAFYTEYAGRAARMSDMLRVIQESTGFDPTACADLWLRSTTIPAVGACP